VFGNVIKIASRHPPFQEQVKEAIHNEDDTINESRIGAQTGRPVTKFSAVNSIEKGAGLYLCILSQRSRGGVDKTAMYTFSVRSAICAQE
jgi:hypothetical protein